jgi:hypothetical protein
VTVDLGPSVASLAKALVLAGTAFIGWQAWRKKHERDFGLLLSVVLVFALAVSPVLSPQYFTWIVPLLFVFLAGRLRSSPLSGRLWGMLLITILLAVLTKWIFPWNYDALLSQSPLAVIVLNVRNVLLLLLAWMLLREGGLIPPPPAKSPQPVRRASITFLIDCVLLAVAVVLFVAVRPQMTPSFTDTTYTIGTDEEKESRMPVSESGESDRIAIGTTLYVTPVSQQRFFRIRPDDCLERIVINGQPLPLSISNFCDGGGHGRIYDFGPYLRPGPNTVRLLVRNTGGPMGVDIIPSVSLLLAFVLLLTAATAVWFALQSRRYVLALRAAAPAWGAKMLYTLVVLWSRSPFARRLFLRILRG